MRERDLEWYFDLVEGNAEVNLHCNACFLYSAGECLLRQLAHSFGNQVGIGLERQSQSQRVRIEANIGLESSVSRDHDCYRSDREFMGGCACQCKRR